MNYQEILGTLELIAIGSSLWLAFMAVLLFSHLYTPRHYAPKRKR